MALRVDILTLFPELFDAFATTSIVGRAVRNGQVRLEVTNFRDFAKDNYGTVDDAPFGGGPGMVLKCEPIFDAVDHVRRQASPAGQVILLSPQGQPMTQALTERLAGQDRLILIAGHYEGFDERIRMGLADMEISVGDFVMSGGEFAAMAITDAVVRLLPGALGTAESIHEESFTDGLLEYPHYTRPRSYRGMDVPEILLSGDHAKIAAWRLAQAQQRTQTRRPDLWQAYTRRRDEPETPS